MERDEYLVLVKEFKVGDRVIVKDIKKINRTLVGFIGTVIIVERDRIGILFDDMNCGHSLAHYLTGADSTKGFWFNDYEAWHVKSLERLEDNRSVEFEFD